MGALAHSKSSTTEQSIQLRKCTMLVLDNYLSKSLPYIAIVFVNAFSLCCSFVSIGLNFRMTDLSLEAKHF